MARGQANRIGLEFSADGGILSYAAQVAAGIRRDTRLGRWQYLAHANYAHNYIWGFRTRTNHPEELARLARIERLIRAPGARIGRTQRAAEYRQLDYHFAEQMLAPELVDSMAAELFAPQRFTDPYMPNFAYDGPPEQCPHPFLYMDGQRLFDSAPFLRICANPDLIAFCREVLGPRAALSWGWAWISQPTASAYQNQNWHRDSAEPLNFIRVFVPLSTIASREDGPLEFIPGTSGMARFFEPRRFGDGELEALKQAMGAGVVLAEKGDIYFANTFALHRGTPPARRRGMLSLLVSIGPSHRTPSIRKVKLRDVPEDIRPTIARNRSFFRRLVR
jgi:hypothetical protein